MLSIISDQRSDDSIFFDEDFETNSIEPSDIVGKCLSSTSNSQFLVHNDSSIESLLYFFGKNIDSELSSVRVVNSNFPHFEKFGNSIEVSSSQETTSFVKETKNIPDNLFCLKPDSRLQTYLVKNAKLGIDTSDCVIIGNDLWYCKGSTQNMSN